MCQSSSNNAAANARESLILLVEDDNALREAFMDTLRALGYQTIGAADACEALRLAHDMKEKNVDLVISDLVMPGMNALELYEALKVATYEGKMLIVTGYPMPHTGATLVEKPGVQWARKPIALGELQVLVDQMLQR